MRLGNDLNMKLFTPFDCANLWVWFNRGSGVLLGGGKIYWEMAAISTSPE